VRGARPQQLGRAQEAADVVGTERRTVSHSHAGTVALAGGASYDQLARASAIAGRKAEAVKTALTMKILNLSIAATPRYPRAADRLDLTW
jgi:hypothetical protein